MGGSEESAFNSANTAQFSTEVLNYGTRADNLVIFTDNPEYFNTNLMTRVVELAASFPAGFVISSVELKVFPSGFKIEGATKVGNTWSLDSPELNDRGSLRLNLSYPVPSDDTFTVDFMVSAEFDITAVDGEGLPLK